MWRITKGQWKIIGITKGKQEIDGFIILPGVTHYKSITINGTKLSFNNSDWTETIEVIFKTEGDLERFLVSFERDSKIETLLSGKNNDK
jgi:hypothetical protein